MRYKISTIHVWLVRNAKLLLAAAWLLAGVPYLMYELVCALSATSGIVFGDVRAILLTLAAWIGAPFLVWRTLLADRQTHINREGHYTDLFTKAVELLGSTRSEASSKPIHNVEAGAIPSLASSPSRFSLSVPNVESRLGAIFALERLCKDSQSDYGAIVETLSAYIREQCGEPLLFRFEGPDPDEVSISIQERALRLRAWRQALGQWINQLRVNPSSNRADVAAAFRVLVRRKEGRRWTGADEHEVEPDLSGANLQGIRIGETLMESIQHDELGLANAYLEGAVLAGFYIGGSPLLKPHVARELTADFVVSKSLVGTHLPGLTLKDEVFFPILEGADLSYAHMDHAKCENGRFRAARLIRANFRDATARNAQFGFAIANNAEFDDADLNSAEFIGTVLQEVSFVGADLSNAVFHGANLHGANFTGALLVGTDFTGAQELEPRMLERAFGTNDTYLPSGMPRPQHWADDASATEGWHRFKERER